MKADFRNVAEEKRFGFGHNWGKFISVLNAERIIEAEESLKDMLWSSVRRLHRLPSRRVQPIPGALNSGSASIPPSVRTARMPWSTEQPA